MFALQLKLVISVILLSSEFSTVYTQYVTTENVVTIKNYLKPEEIVAALNKLNKSDPVKNSDNQHGGDRTARAKTYTPMKDAFACAIALDASCLVDRAEDIVDNANNNLLQLADSEARRASVGRAKADSEESTPSALISSIAQMVLEIPELVRDSISGFLGTGKTGLGDEEDDDEEDDDEEDEKDSKSNKANNAEEEVDEDNVEDDDEEKEEEEENADVEDEVKNEPTSKSIRFPLNNRRRCGNRRRCPWLENGSGEGFFGDFEGFGGNYGYGTAMAKSVGGSRGKKKKKKAAIIKLLLLGLIIKAKITLLLKLLAAALQVKFFFIALANLLINLARFWWDLKKGGNEQPQKVIYYEHAQHQHHYDGGEDWHSSSPGGGGYWARAYEPEDDDKSAQDMAYAKHKPVGTSYSRVDDKPNISWNPWAGRKL